VIEEGINVPWIAAGSGVTPGIHHAEVHLLDVFPTLAESAGGGAGSPELSHRWPQSLVHASAAEYPASRAHR
jgi:arylsulfatase A-like enzyme